MNTFGSESKYRSLAIELQDSEIDPSKLDVKILVGRIVYVNYPQMHEAKVTLTLTLNLILTLSNLNLDFSPNLSPNLSPNPNPNP
jgi:hypothetical protein